MDDLISRQAAIDALDKRFDSIPMEQTTEILLLRKDLRELPSAQPEKRTEERTETHSCDLIDRQAALDALHAHLMYRIGTESNKKRLDEWINSLPSAQPEIIRCKDCKHWREGTAFSYCDKLYGMGVLDALDYMTAEDDYCSMAERRTDGSD